MEIYVYWFLLALVLIGLEMVTGTFYLLVLSIAMAVGGLAALLGAGMVWQLVLGAATGHRRHNHFAALEKHADQ